MEKQRRSSIRNPNNLRTNTNDNLNEAGRASRRVSFSSRNRVKPFIKGSETTVWDLSYEEAIHSTQSSQEITNKSLEKCSPNIENNSVDSIEQNQKEEEESTDSDHANQTLFNIESLSMEIEEIDRPTQIHTRQIMVAIDKENLPVMINREFDMETTCQKEQTICQSINNMEITCQNTMKNPDISDMEFTCQMTNLKSNLVVKSMSDKTDMEITCQQIKSDQFEAEKENLHFSTNDMEFTCQLPPITITSPLNKTKMYLTSQQSEKIESQIELNQTDMEFTCRLPNYSVKSVQNKSVMELTCQQSEKVESEIGSDKSDMEFTCRLPNSTALKSVMELTCQEEKIKESQIELNQTDMEFTYKLPNYTTNEALKSMENKTEMELTCQQAEKVGSEIGSDKSDMEFTCRLPNSTTLKSVMELTCQQQQEKIEINKTDMEFTYRLPSSSINKSLKSVANKIEMELTCLQSEKVESEIRSDETEMEFTCRLTNSTISAPLKSVANKTEMELTCQQPEKVDESAIGLGKTDMEFTCQLPNSTMNPSLKSIPNQSEIEPAYQQVERVDEIESNKICQQNTINKTTNRTSNKRQTIFLVQNYEDNSNIQTDDLLSNTMKISNAIKELDSSPISNNTDQQIKNIDADQCEIKASELSQIKDVNQDFNVEKKQQPGGKHERAKDTKCLSPISSTIKRQTLNNLEVTKTKNSPLKAEESVMEQLAVDVELSRSLSNSTNVEKLQEDSDVLVVDNLVNLTEPKLLEVKNEVLEQQQISLDGDVEEMEWSSITPRKSIRKSTIQENINENQVEIDRARKRSLLSSFIPLDSPQIIKKPTLNENQIQKSSMNLSTKFTTPDKNKKKSHIPTPISSGKSKIKKLTQPDEHLDFLPIETTTPKQSINQNKKVLYSQKIDKNFKKLDSTYIKTPDRSGVRIMSPCIDDTQQLIDATVNLPERSINKRNKSPEIEIALPSTIKKVSEIEITLPSISGIQLNFDDNENINDTAASLMENRLFQNINNTFVLNKLLNRKYQNQDDVEENVYIDDCSIELVTSPDNTKITINNYDISDDYDFPLTRKFLEDFELKQISNEFVQSPIIDIQKKQKIIEDFIDNFEFPRLKIPSVEDIGKLIENLRIKYDQKLENISIIEISDSEHHVMVLEEKIRALGKERDECIWKLAGIDNNLYKFNIVYSTLILTVELNPDNETVSNFAIDIDTREQTNLLIYIHKAIKHKLNVSNVQSSLGQSYDLIAFLQYIEMVIEKFITFIKEFTIYSFYDTSFDKDWLSFKIRNAAKLKFFIISVNMVNFENLTDDDIKVTLKFGDCDVRKLKKIVRKCSKLPRFLRNSIKTIEAYCV